MNYAICRTVLAVVPSNTKNSIINYLIRYPAEFKMLEKPEIPDELIAACVQVEYRLDVAQVTFLPLGYDVNTAVYRIVDQVGAAFFLKLRMGNFNPITVAMARYLNNLGIHTILAPIETYTGILF